MTRYGFLGYNHKCENNKWGIFIMAEQKHIYNEMLDPYDIDFTSTTRKVPWYDKIIHSLYGAYSFNVSWIIFGYYLVYFYTDIVGLNPIIAGTIMLFARIFDCFTDLWMGYKLDNVCYRWGRYRSWCIFGIVPLFVLFVGTFTAIPTEDEWLKVAWCAFFYGCFGAIGATLSFMPQIAQFCNMTRNPRERENIAILKSVFTNLAQVVAASLFMPLVTFFGGGNQAQGFFWAAVVIGLTVMLFQILNVNMTKKYELNKDGTHREHLLNLESENTFAQIKSFTTNKPAVILLLGQILQQIMQAIKNGMIIFIFIYFLALESFYPVAMLANTIAMMLGVFLMKPMIRMIRDTNRAFLASMIISSVTSIGLYLMCKGYGDTASAESMEYGALFALFIVNGIFTGTYVSFREVMVPAVVDYGEWQNGSGQSGMVSALDGFCKTIGAALGAQFFGILLAGSGYIANIKQDPETIDLMLMIAFIAPAVVTAMHFVLQCFYGLPDKKLAVCMAEIKARKERAEKEAQK